jgi:hypothetical protein
MDVTRLKVSQTCHQQAVTAFKMKSLCAGPRALERGFEGGNYRLSRTEGQRMQ